MANSYKNSVYCWRCHWTGNECINDPFPSSKQSAPWSSGNIVQKYSRPGAMIKGWRFYATIDMFWNIIIGFSEQTCQKLLHKTVPFRSVEYQFLRAIGILQNGTEQTNYYMFSELEIQIFNNVVYSCSTKCKPTEIENQTLLSFEILWFYSQTLNNTSFENSQHG